VRRLDALERESRRATWSLFFLTGLGMFDFRWTASLLRRLRRPD
jgi:hypothetical protein